MWSPNCRLQRAVKTSTDTCKTRDLWVTQFVVLHNVNKIALAFTSKEIGNFQETLQLQVLFLRAQDRLVIS